MKICIVGGGTAGFIAATILKKFLNAEITVVYSSNIGIIGVGEGSTEHFSEYMRFVGIDQYSIIKECDATYKAGIFFDGWSEKPYMHYVGPPFNNRLAQYNFIYSYLIANGYNEIVPKTIKENKIETWYLNKNESPPFNQFHFNTYKLNNFLHNFSESMGIKVVDDEINNVNIDSSGNIKSVTGKKQDYEADFFIDATGFKRLLIDKMGYEWISFKDFLKMKSAVVFPTPAEEEYNLFTTAKAMKHGWLFNIPVWERQGNGYIFDSDYISMDDAKKEVVDLFGEVDFGKEFNFDAGYVKEPWKNNCLAVGISSSFVEPLEATSIGTTIQQVFLIMHKLPQYSNLDIKKYNKTFKFFMENIRDFIFLHYMTKKENTQFWKDIKKINPPDSLEEKLSLWENRLPIFEDFSSESNYQLFSDHNFILVMHGLQIFNKEKIKKYFEKHSQETKSFAEEKINNFWLHEKFAPTIGHKKMIDLIRQIS